MSYAKKTSKTRKGIDDFLSQVGSHLGVTNLEKLQHHVTFLSSYFNVRTSKYEQSLQSYHQDYKPEELKSGLNKWYIVFTPLQHSRMQIKVHDPKIGTVYNILYQKGAILNANTVHAGEFCNDTVD